MAGTGLPIPKGSGALSQPAPTQRVIDGDRFSVAQEWRQIAADGAKLAATGFDTMDQEIHRQKIAYLADQEVEIARQKTDLRDKFAFDPQGFDAAWRGITDGKMQGAQGWAIPHLKRALGSAGNSVYATILDEKRTRDRHLETEKTKALIDQNAGDVIGSAMAGTFGTADGQVRIEQYRSTLQASVSAGLHSPEWAAAHLDDTMSKAEGELAARAGLQVYREKGFDAAASNLRRSILENEGLSLSPDGKRKAFAHALQSIRLQKQQDQQDRVDAVAVSQDLREQIKAGMDVDPGILSDTIATLRRSGGVAELSRLTAGLAIRDATAPLANLPPGQAMDYVRGLRTGGGAVAPQLAQAESAGKPDAVNQFGYAGLYQFGAPRLADLGIYKPGSGEDMAAWSRAPSQAPGKWTGEFAIPGFPQVRTLADFLASPDAQQAAFKLQAEKADQEIRQRGLDRFVGQTIGGTIVTRAGIQAMIHLGGPGGAQAYLESAGATNPADANGKSVGDYLKLGEGAVDQRVPFAGRVVHAVQDQYIAQMRKAWPDIKGVIERGHVSDPADFAAVRYAAEVARDPAWQREVADLEVAQRGIQAVKGAPAGQGQAVLDQIGQQFDQDGIRTVSEDRVLKALEENYQRKLRQVTDSPVDFHVAIGGKAPDALDLGSADLARAGVQQRVAIARGVAVDQQVAPASPFRLADRQQLAGAIAAGNAQQAGIAMDALYGVPDEMLAPALGPELRAAVQGAARSSDGGKYSAAMGFLDRMWARAPETTKQLFGDEAIHALQTWQSNIRYMTPEQMAEQRAKQAADPQVRAREKINLQDGLELARKVKPDDIAGAFDESWLPFDTPGAPIDVSTRNALMGDFEQVYSRRYAETFDKDLAKKQAVEQLKTKWGASPVNGGRLMLNRPELYYPAVQGTWDWMAKALEADLEKQIGKPQFAETKVNEAGIGGDAPVTLKRQNWTYGLIADRITQGEAQAGRLPSYQVVITDAATGRADVLPRRARWSTEVVDDARAKFERERASQAEVQAMFDRADQAAGQRLDAARAYIQSRR